MPANATVDGINLETKVAFLRDPGSYPERPSGVVAKETHMSWVFLTDRHAYKLKKPVRRPFLDFTTIELRRHFCREELRLNRRLAPEAYLGMVPLGVDDRARLHLGRGRPVDWLVQMRRLPETRTLEHRLAARRVSREEIRRLALVLAAFYRDVPRIASPPDEYRAHFAQGLAKTEKELRRPSYGLSPDLIGEVGAAQRRFLRTKAARLLRRAADGRIVEGHGDLRPEHVYLGKTPEVLDCLEFSPILRTVDPADELAYLAMECERAGDARVGAWLFQDYGEANDDVPPQDLIAFYKSYRAALRAKIAVWHLDDEEVRDPEKWPARAQSYLRQAASYRDRMTG